MFLGYKVNADGLKVCPDKADVVLNFPSPRCLKDVQKLNGKLASLKRFLSKSAEKSLPFFKILKKCTKKSDFQWTQEAEASFKQMKALISELPMLSAPKEKEELIMYLAAAKEAISAVLITERDGKQMPVYFVSRALQGLKINYTPMEKLVLALVSASKRLKRYFQAHTIVVITDQSIKQLLSSSEITDRLLKWRFELEGYDIQYRPRISFKGQVLADFIVERPEEESVDEPMAEQEELPEPWTLFMDGSSCVDGFGAGLILMNQEGLEFTYAMRFRFEATNNKSKYVALIAGLRIAEKMGVKNLQANVDSRLVANQVNGSFMAKEPSIIQYSDKVKTLASNFREFSSKQVPRSENKKADALSKIASTSFAHLSKQVLVEELKEKSIEAKEVLVVVEEEGYTWMTPIYEYLIEEVLLEDKKKARAIRRKAARPLQANYVLREIHEGSFGMHSGPRSMVHRLIPRNPQQTLTPITSPWQFYKWGIDIAGPFPEVPGKVKFLIVAIDYFTKWIKAKLVATITGNQVKKFVWDNIVCRFGLPGEIVSDNGKQFCDNPFKDWCEKLCIRQCFASVKHPQANGLVERANRSLGEGIKARLDERSKDWMGELSHVLWVHRTMIKSSNGETPFSLTYGTEACFIYSREKGTFYKLPYPSKETFGCYLNNTGYNTDAQVQIAADKWGRNVIEYPQTPLLGRALHGPLSFYLRPSVMTPALLANQHARHQIEVEMPPLVVEPSPAPKPSTQDDPSMNKVHGSGSSSCSAIGSCVLSQAYAKIPKLYRAYELCDKNEQLHVFDSEETLEDAEKSQLKMNEFQKDEKFQDLKIQPIDYEKLNKLFALGVYQLLKASLTEDIKNLVITPCMEIRIKDLHDQIERISKESKDVSNESKTVDTVCNDAFEVKQELSKRIVELEKDLSKSEAKGIAFEIALQHKSRENNSLKIVQKENENFMASLQLENAHLKQTYKDLFESVQRSKVEIKQCDEVKVKDDFDEIETKNIELEYRVASLIKENEHLKLTYKNLFDSIKKSRAQTKTSNVTQDEAENLKSQLFEFAETKFKNILGKIKFFKKKQLDISDLNKGSGENVCDNAKCEFQTKFVELEKVLTQQTKDFNDAKLELSNRTAKFEAYFEKLEKTKVVLERQLARKVDDSKAEKDQFLKEINYLRTQLENLKGKSVQTKFDKHSILGKPPADNLVDKLSISQITGFLPIRCRDTKG
ncbi:reverse transcriptase domain-containing protein [Tanacetum coccineum]|uniref:Reverse transcriptase domain-containing protein n=1 Tax=Tanacetum coccineum TaxID=301880 RepID=A0ABQ4WFY3_9ASTR